MLSMTAFPLLLRPFQLGYVTDDLDHAMRSFRQLGIQEFLVTDVGSASGQDTPHGARIAMAYVGDQMIELIAPVGTPAPVYVDHLPRSGSHRCIFNHVGFSIPDRDGWQRMIDELDRQDLEISWRGSNPLQFDVIYADTRTRLGHYCEFIRRCPEMDALFDRVPRTG
jgi:hypothetical protein